MRRRIDRKRSTRLRIENDKDNNDDDDAVDFKKILFLQIPYIQTILATELTHSSRTYKHFFFVYSMFSIFVVMFFGSTSPRHISYIVMISYTFYT